MCVLLWRWCVHDPVYRKGGGTKPRPPPFLMPYNANVRNLMCIFLRQVSICFLAKVLEEQRV